MRFPTPRKYAGESQGMDQALAFSHYYEKDPEVIQLYAVFFPRVKADD